MQDIIKSSAKSEHESSLVVTWVFYFVKVLITVFHFIILVDINGLGFLIFSTTRKWILQMGHRFGHFLILLY